MKLKINGEEDSSQSVQFITRDLETGHIAIDLLPGEYGTNIQVTMTEDTSKPEFYSFEGSSKNSNREVTAKGSVSENEGLTLDLTIKILSQVVGDWEPVVSMSMNPSAIALDIKPGKKITHITFLGIRMPLVSEEEQSFVENIAGLSTMVFSNVVDFRLNMKDDGNLIAKWSPKGFAGGLFEPGESRNGIVKYNVVDDQVVVLISITDLITGNRSSRADINISDLLPLLSMFSDGLFFNLVKADEKDLTVKVTREMMLPYLDTIKKFVPMLIEGIDPEILDEMFEITPEELAQSLIEIIDAIEDSEQFDLIINLARAQAQAE